MVKHSDKDINRIITVDMQNIFLHNYYNESTKNKIKKFVDNYKISDEEQETSSEY